MCQTKSQQSEYSSISGSTGASMPTAAIKPARNIVPSSRSSSMPHAVRPGGIALTPGVIAHVSQINAQVNAAIAPHYDIDLYGVEDYWTLPLTFENKPAGDCEDYALEKRRRLLNAGVNPDHLYLSVVTSDQTGRHLVLVLATDHGDYVLDNLHADILPWADTGYVWIARQSAGNLLSWSWVSLADQIAAQRK